MSEGGSQCWYCPHCGEPYLTERGHANHTSQCNDGTEQTKMAVGDDDPLRQWLRDRLDNGSSVVLKSRKIARDVELSSNQIGVRLNALKEDAAGEFVVEVHSNRTCGNVWKVRRCGAGEIDQ